jgi:large conductance mechanosensitive channel
MGMLSEFKAFAVKGNALDLAVGVIIGAGFGKIVNSIVNDLFMPVVGSLMGGFDFSNLYLPLRSLPEGSVLGLAEARELGIPVFAYGSFITVLLDFLILAFIVFMIVKQVNRLQRQAPPAPVGPPPAPPEDILLLREIRDRLSERSGGGVGE